MKVLITGASQGLGLATTELLLKAGHKVIGVSRHCPPHLLEHSQYTHYSCDFFQESEQALFETFLRTQTVDFLVNNFAFFERRFLENLDYETFVQTMRMNCYLPLKTTQLLNARGLLQGVINISSLGGITEKEKFPGFGGYAMSKAALTTLTQTLAVEYPALRTLCIAPGAMKTQMLDKALGEGYDGGIEPEKVAELMLFFMSEQGHALDGQVVVINSN